MKNIIIKGIVFLKPNRDVSIQRFHQWIFSGAISHIEGDIDEGDWVSVQSFTKNTIAFGHYYKHSISVRILTFADTQPNDDFYFNQLNKALFLRQQIGVLNTPNNCFRLVHGEGDYLSGLIIDVYNTCVIIQAHSIGMHKDRHLIANALQQLLKNKIDSIYYKSNNTLPKNFSLQNTEEYLLTPSITQPLITINENNHLFYVNYKEGQKTGFFLDQRTNRNILAGIAKNKKVLNTCCYTGGFSIYALKAGASLVHSVDESKKAIELTKQNMILNNFDYNIHECFTQDVYKYLEQTNEQYDIIILDPPAFAKHKDAKHNAMKGYQRLNALAMKKINKNGFLFTFSCSQVVDKELFYNTIVSAALQTKRQMQVLQHLSQSPDHPISIYHPEGNYLKGLVIQVD